MATTLCPLYSDAFYTYTIDLNNKVHTLTFAWNARLQQWLMDVGDSEGNPIIKGVSLVPVFPLIYQYSLDEIEGDFILLPMEKSTLEIHNPRELHRTHYLIYDSRF